MNMPKWDILNRSKWKLSLFHLILIANFAVLVVLLKVLFMWPMFEMYMFVIIELIGLGCFFHEESFYIS